MLSEPHRARVISATDGIVKLRLLSAGDRTFEIVPCSGMDIRTFGKSVSAKSGIRAGELFLVVAHTANLISDLRV